ncbi:MAG: radical SAM protein [Phycisphaerae bacterium]|nr:radical SAM protein [Phycisphaerae bacterium]
MKNITGFGKFVIYSRIALHVCIIYLFKVKPWQYPRFLRRAFILLMSFRHNAVVKVFNGYKLQLYLPAYPCRAFFYALDSKLLKTPPGPITIVFSMTKACSYKCPHCYQKKDGGPDLQEQKLIETLINVRDKGVAMFDIEGGEPFLRFERLLNLIKALDSRSEIWVNTTGMHVDKNNLTALQANGLFGLMISIHSPDRKIHDDFTGIAGSFETACQAIKLCKDLDLVVSINSVLAEQEINDGKLNDLMELAKSLKADFVQLIHPKPSGLWLDKSDHMQNDKSFITDVQQQHLLYNSKAKQFYPALAAQVFEERKTGFGCTAGAVDRFYVNATGEIQPCEFLNISFGNVNIEDFDVIYNRMRSYFNNPCQDWLCCTQAQSISEIIKKYELQATPLPWQYTQELIKTWDRGPQTPLYKKLGIYKK